MAKTAFWQALEWMGLRLSVGMEKSLKNTAVFFWRWSWGRSDRFCASDPSAMVGGRANVWMRMVFFHLHISRGASGVRCAGGFFIVFSENVLIVFITNFYDSTKRIRISGGRELGEFRLVIAFVHRKKLFENMRCDRRRNRTAFAATGTCAHHDGDHVFWIIIWCETAKPGDDFVMPVTV